MTFKVLKRKYKLKNFIYRKTIFQNDVEKKDMIRFKTKKKDSENQLLAYLP